MKLSIFAACAAACLVAVSASAQEAGSADLTVEATPASQTNTARAVVGSVVKLATVETLNSASAKAGDKVEFTLTEPLLAGDVELAPAGARAIGSIVDANTKASGGRPGDLYVSVNSLEIDGLSIPLKGASLHARGTDLSKSSRFTAGALKGSEAEIAAGATVEARLAQNLIKGPDGLQLETPTAEQLAAVPRPVRIATKVPRPPPGMGQIIFFREVVYFGGGWPLDIHQGPDFREHNLVTLNGGNYLVLELPPGSYEFSTLKDGGDPMTINVEADEVYFVKGVSMGLGAIPPTMIGRSDAEIFNQINPTKRVPLRKKKSSR